ncbi:hypothetical protein OG963_20320 [Streptomyces sp. NBC_01707]|uniref:hypothetical protein n=1 Tax=unclassified Streptomyces TaxID=2593676 RepID=UPI00088E5025|nr:MULTISPECIES: hypothetical protein [unclassified Streptomyces]MDX3765214.1 hypothetical protein [Streptomyces sp. AK08-01B]MDX3814793.1 hypothetical protein [Streptomyces sp. AK08-01A]SCY64612.1 hypothetical protein SAMN02745898_102887 [Streptomyces sp. 136MFCol5.1]
MAILDDELMTKQPRPLGRNLVLCASALCVALVTGCTSEPGGPNAPASSPGQPRESPSSPSDLTDDKLGKQVERTLDTAEVSDSDPTFVEAGLERVGDGFHSVPELTRGHSYKLSVVCAGKGKIILSIAVKNPVRQTLVCDGVTFRQDLTASAAPIKIDGDGMPGATGMVGWRLDKADK